MRVVLAIVVLLLALASPAVAKGQPQPLVTSTSGASGGHAWYLSPLDTQGCGPGGDSSCQVFNSTLSVLGDVCGWNDQDSILRSGGGYVEGTFTDRLCIIADYDGSYGPANQLYPKGVYVNVSAPGDTLTVALDNDFGGHWDAGPSVADGNRRLWRICATDTVADGRPLADWPEVPDSNGGRGQLVQYSLSVTSLTSRTRNVYSRFEVATRYHDPPVNGERHTITDCP